MRQLSVLAIGLVLITFWGIGLRSYLRSQRTAQATVEQGDTAQSLAQESPPAKLAPGNARKLTDRQSPIDLRQSATPVSLAAYSPAPIPETADATIVVQESFTNQAIWTWPTNVSHNQSLVRTVWIAARSNNVDLVFGGKLLDAHPATVNDGSPAQYEIWLKESSGSTKITTVNISVEGSKKTLVLQNAIEQLKISEANSVFLSALIDNGSPNKLTITKSETSGDVLLRLPTGDMFQPSLQGITTSNRTPEIPGTTPTLRLLGTSSNQYALRYRLSHVNVIPTFHAIQGEYKPATVATGGNPAQPAEFEVRQITSMDANANTTTLGQNVEINGNATRKLRTMFLASNDKDHQYRAVGLDIEGLNTVPVTTPALSLTVDTATAATDETTKLNQNADYVFKASLTPTVDFATSYDRGLTVSLFDVDSKLEFPNVTQLEPVGTGSATKLEAEVKDLQLANTSYNIGARFYLHGQLLQEQVREAPQKFKIRSETGGFLVESVGPSSLGIPGITKIIKVRFNRPLLDTLTNAVLNNSAEPAFEILYSATGDFENASPLTIADAAVALNNTKTEIQITLTDQQIRPGSFLVRLFTQRIKDQFGNTLRGNRGEYNEEGEQTRYEKTLGGGVSFASGIDRFQPTEGPVVTRGVTQGKAPFIEYPEYVKPRKPTKGFNPNDKVETRVSRLYFYRDAHRVAQILNRKVQSYNRQEVSVRRRMANSARQQAESLTTQRMTLEQDAINKARKTRELENELSDTQRKLNTTVQQAQAAAAEDDPVASQLADLVQKFAQDAQALENEVRDAREQEIAANDRVAQAERQEQLAKTDQFRLEAAAAHADPDTFAAGDPASIDPVAQVSISVIGEGLIHLRGPLKGINQVRIMIDQIDSPQGQVRVNVHSTQINGDEAEHLEVVANRIQTYIDQARFLTVQSAEMLRKSVVHVAARRAEQMRGMYPGSSQAERDQLYLHAFFGRDFIDELRSMDSELLHTGNKLLSLHSMDVTSLSSALMLLALANNQTRLEILQEFEQLIQSELTVREQQYIHNSIGCCTGGCKIGCKHHKHGPQLCLFAQNGTFTSLRGFFDANIAHADTISPLQREVIRLAQIMKARLITEMEYKQRVMERAVIEQRLESTEVESQQLDRERFATRQLEIAKSKIVEARRTVLPNVTKTMSVVDQGNNVLREADRAISDLAQAMRAVGPALTNLGGARTTIDTSVKQQLQSTLDLIEQFRAVRAKNFALFERDGQQIVNESPDAFLLRIDRSQAQLKDDEDKDVLDPTYDDLTVVCFSSQTAAEIVRSIDSLISVVESIQTQLKALRRNGSITAVKVEQLRTSLDNLRKRIALYNWILDTDKTLPDAANGKRALGSISEIRKILENVGALLVIVEGRTKISASLDQTRNNFLQAFSSVNSSSTVGDELIRDSFEVLQIWTQFKGLLQQTYDSGQVTKADGESKGGTTVPDIDQWIDESDTKIEEWLQAVSALEAAQTIAQDARRPLDHKKFLDMLIDDLEEKYIELMEGTRAHTANIDNYLKRLTTSLDDDFNTQFYYPAFRLVREASQFKRVEFGQTETTNVLVNNRQLGKVSPSATMEFDLPERDILIAEGLDAAMAIYNDVGALINDPNLLALAKSQAGGSTSMPAAGSLGGRAAVRSVLPGLQGETSEQLLAQNAGAGPDFESNVEKLIPDPAIYKFETGTGYEIRPVIAPDGQAVVFDFQYLYKTQIREPVRADEKHLGRIRQHFIDTDVQLSNFELREVSRYTVALKAERTANGVPLLEDIPLVGVLWRPLPNREKSLQQNIVMAQATIFPTLFDLMGLRWAPTVSDLDPLRISNREYLVRGRHQFLENWIYDYSSARVDEFLRVPDSVRRGDLYRSQESIPTVHPNGYRGPGLDLENSRMREGYDPEEAYVNPGMIPSRSSDGALYLPHRLQNAYDQMPRGVSLIEEVRPTDLTPSSLRSGVSSRGPELLPQELPPPVQNNPAQGDWEAALPEPVAPNGTMYQGYPGTTTTESFGQNPYPYPNQ